MQSQRTVRGRRRQVAGARLVVAGALLMTGGAAALAVDVCESEAWCDTFETYAIGLLIGQDCVGEDVGHECDDFADCDHGVTWEAWNNDPGLGLSTVVAGPGDAGQAVAVSGPDDLVKTYRGLGVETGRWQWSGDLYIPEDYSGEMYFILLNTYTSSDDANWSTQVRFESDGDAVRSDFDDGEQNDVTFVRGAWKEVRVVMDLDEPGGTDQGQRIYYDDQLVVEKSWVDGVSGGGQPRLGALDLFANGASVVYWDNLEICRLAECPGDLDADGQVGIDDLVAVLEAYGDEGGPEDLDRSGLVDFMDILIVLDAWGPCQ